jgi:hypothetical protein
MWIIVYTLWEPPTMQTDYSCRYQSVGGIDPVCWHSDRPPAHKKLQSLHSPWQDPVGAAVGGFQSLACCVLAEEEVDAPFEIELRQHMARLRPVLAARHTSPSTSVHSDLERCTHIFLRQDTTRRALEPPYSGSYQVLSRRVKTLQLLVRRRPVTVSTDRVNTAYTLVPAGVVCLHCGRFPQPDGGPAWPKYIVEFAWKHWLIGDSTNNLWSCLHWWQCCLCVWKREREREQVLQGWWPYFNSGMTVYPLVIGDFKTCCF